MASMCLALSQLAVAEFLIKASMCFLEKMSRFYNVRIRLLTLDCFHWHIESYESLELLYQLSHRHVYELSDYHFKRSQTQRVITRSLKKPIKKNVILHSAKTRQYSNQLAL